jgi:VanZ family protein
MKKLSTIVPRWIPALIVMALIFAFSSQPSENLPNFNILDKLVKKGGHALGYALLTLSYLHAMRDYKFRFRLAWAFAILYAISDEFHQSFVPGRGPSVWDVIIFDNLGMLLALFLYSRFMKNRMS